MGEGITMDSEIRSTEHQEEGAFSRRDFLKAAATFGVAATAGGVLTGCATPEASAAETEENKARAAFEAAAEPIPPVAPPASWTHETDVVVVGSGAAGMNAAIRLGQAGYKVIMLERNDNLGGNSRHASVFSNLGGHRMANEQGWALPSFPYDPDKVVEWVMDAQQMSGDPELIRAMAIEGPKCIDWMIDEAGAKWHPGAPVPAGNQLLKWGDFYTETNAVNVNFGTFEHLAETAKAAGVDIRTSTEVKALVSDGTAILGLKALSADGAEEFYHAAKGVVLAAGGMEVNRAMMARYSAQALAGIANIATPPNGTGECIRMGQGAGADLAGYDSTGAFDGGVWWREYGEYDTVMECHINKDGNQAVRQPWLRINREGNRVPYISFTGGAFPYATQGPPSAAGFCDTAAIEMTQPGGVTYAVFDSKYEQLVLDNYFKQGICRKAHIVAPDDPYIDRVPEWQRDWRTGFQLMIDGGAIKKCDTLEELETELGLPAGMLVDEVAKWNEACEKGEDYVPMYKYDPSWLIPISEPPYYGTKLGGHVFGSKCGLRVNPDMQVISTEGQVIPGLFAAWHTAGGSSGDNNFAGRPLTGMYADLGLAFVGGYMAAGGVLAADGKA
jgi:fumarate reductase flavoprotein subunit